MKKVLFILLTALLYLCHMPAGAQSKKVKIGCIGFYNLENLFDTLDNPLTNDEDFLPGGNMHYNTAVYRSKLDNLSKVLSEMGTELSPDGPAIIGVAEVEERSVLEDLVKQKAIAKRNYQVVHYPSHDERGIDVGLLYNPLYFKVLDSRSIPVVLYKQGERPDYTRDILWVYGLYDGEPMHIFVNHWPSRRGGQLASEPLRAIAAQTARKFIDSLQAADTVHAKYVLMGDLNDDPVNKSVKEVLGAKTSLKNLKPADLYNPWANLYKKGYGTLAYEDSWNLFDQIIISGNFCDTATRQYRFYKAEVFKKPYLIATSGRYKGYPFRTYSFGVFEGGYSDHFPTYIFICKPVE